MVNGNARQNVVNEQWNVEILASIYINQQC